MPISRLGLVVHGGRPEAVSGARTVREWCARYGIGCVDIDVWQGQEAGAADVTRCGPRAAPTSS